MFCIWAPIKHIEPAMLRPWDKLSGTRRSINTPKRIPATPRTARARTALTPCRRYPGTKAMGVTKRMKTANTRWIQGVCTNIFRVGSSKGSAKTATQWIKQAPDKAMPHLSHDFLWFSWTVRIMRMYIVRVGVIRPLK